MNILLDTNFLLSSICFGNNVYHKILNKILINYNCFMDEFILNEFQRVIFKLKNKGDKTSFKANIKLIEEVAFNLPFKRKYLSPIKNFLYKTRDFYDDRIVTGALLNGVDFIITDDKDLLEDKHLPIRAIKPLDFVKLQLISL